MPYLECPLKNVKFRNLYLGAYIYMVTLSIGSFEFEFLLFKGKIDMA